MFTSNISGRFTWHQINTRLYFIAGWTVHQILMLLTTMREMEPDHTSETTFDWAELCVFFREMDMTDLEISRVYKAFGPQHDNKVFDDEGNKFYS